MSASHVLVVDDEASVCRVASRLLRQLGFQSVEAEDGIVALEHYRDDPNRFCAVLLDMTMPRMGGQEVFRQLRGIHEDVRVVLSSGYNEQEVTSLLVGRGQAGFLQKPYDSASLSEALEAVLGTS